MLLSRFRGSSALTPNFSRLSLVSLKYSTTLKPKVKLCEVPGVCSSDEWNSVVQESRAALRRLASPCKVQGAPTGALSTQTVIKRLQELSHSNTYLVDTFKHLLTNWEANSTKLRWPGLITLMLSVGVGNPFQANNFVSKALEDVIWSSQVTLAEIVNLLYCSFLFQKENYRLVSSKRTTGRPVTPQNEVARLVGHYFTSSVLQKTSSLRNDKVLFLVAEVLESFSATRLSNPTGSHLMRNLKSWEHDTFHPQGLLLATGCQSALELAGHSELSQQLAFEFGAYFTLAIKANADIQQLWNYQTSHSSIINVSSFPVALHLTNNPETLAYLYRSRETLHNLDYHALNAILMDKGALDDARRQLSAYVDKATSILEEFQSIKNYEIIELLLKLARTLENINQ